MKKRLKTLLPDNVKTGVSFQGKQLSSWFDIKDKIKLPHKRDLHYHAGCPERSCNDDYVGETVRSISERGRDHSRSRVFFNHLLRAVTGRDALFEK